jgi:hypothetical protein
MAAGITSIVRCTTRLTTGDDDPVQYNAEVAAAPVAHATACLTRLKYGASLEAGAQKARNARLIFGSDATHSLLKSGDADPAALYASLVLSRTPSWLEGFKPKVHVCITHCYWHGMLCANQVAAGLAAWS